MTIDDDTVIGRCSATFRAPTGEITVEYEVSVSDLAEPYRQIIREEWVELAEEREIKEALSIRIAELEEEIEKRKSDMEKSVLWNGRYQDRIAELEAEVKHEREGVKELAQMNYEKSYQIESLEAKLAKAERLMADVAATCQKRGWHCEAVYRINETLQDEAMK